MKMQSAPSPGKPPVTKRGNGTNYHQFTLAYYDGAKRVKKRFSDLEGSQAGS
jgi:hypothetical protein